MQTLPIKRYHATLISVESRINDAKLAIDKNDAAKAKYHLNIALKIICEEKQLYPLNPKP